MKSAMIFNGTNFAQRKTSSVQIFLQVLQLLLFGSKTDRSLFVDRHCFRFLWLLTAITTGSGSGRATPVGGVSQRGRTAMERRGNNV
jgi:hypothetical protein